MNPSNSTHPTAFCGAAMGPMLHASSGDDVGMGGGGGMSMAMYMSGFRWSLFAEPSDVPCLNLFLPSWTLNSRPKFFLGMLAVALLAMVTEGVSFLRLKARKTKAAGGRGERRAWRSKRVTSMVCLGLHGMQALLGYLLMIAAMTYSIELLLSAVVGLVIGHGVFFEKISSKSDDETDREGNEEAGIDGEVAVAATVTTNPCCAFMADEAMVAAQIEGRGDGGDVDETGNAAGLEDEGTYGSMEEPLLPQRQVG